MIEISSDPLSPEKLVERVKTGGSGCVVTYIGLIRDNSQGKKVKSVEYQDTDNTARDKLSEIVGDAKARWPIENIGMWHRIGVLNVGDINLVVAVAAPHREEGFAACQFVLDQFKSRLPTHKTELYLE